MPGSQSLGTLTPWSEHAVLNNYPLAVPGQKARPTGPQTPRRLPDGPTKGTRVTKQIQVDPLGGQMMRFLGAPGPTRASSPPPPTARPQLEKTAFQPPSSRLSRAISQRTLAQVVPAVSLSSLCNDAHRRGLWGCSPTPGAWSPPSGTSADPTRAPESMARSRRLTLLVSSPTPPCQEASSRRVRPQCRESQGDSDQSRSCPPV